MVHHAEDPAAFTVASADALGGELARAVMAQAGTPGEGVAAFARSLSVDLDRLQAELIYLSILTTRFALGAALGPGETAGRVAAAFERTLWEGPSWRATAGGLEARAREYRDAFNHPHPDLGRAYAIGRTFARRCRCSHDVAAIEFGARAYMAHLPAVVGLLRRVTVA